jgi:hypothetical protein
MNQRAESTRRGGSFHTEEVTMFNQMALECRTQVQLTTLRHLAAIARGAVGCSLR